MAMMEICDFISSNYDKKLTEEINTYIPQDTDEDEDVDNLIDTINANLGEDIRDLHYIEKLFSHTLPSFSLIYKNRYIEIIDCCDHRSNYYWNIRIIPVDE